MIARKKDLIAYKSPKEILVLGFVGTAAFLGLIILIYSTQAGFVPNNPDPGWGLNRPDPFQSPGGPPKGRLDLNRSIEEWVVEKRLR